MTEQNQEIPEFVGYAGFWVRCGAMLVDTVIILMISLPLTVIIYSSQLWQGDRAVMGGLDILINWLFPIVVVILFWRYKGATPGKMMTGMMVVDEKTGLIPRFKQSGLRYAGYIVSTLPLMLGFFWIAIDKKNRDGTIKLQALW